MIGELKETSWTLHPRDSVCIWKRKNSMTEYWDTSCGHSHLFFEGSPDSNEYTFCPYCGRTIQEEE